MEQSLCLIEENVKTHNMKKIQVNLDTKNKPNILILVKILHLSHDLIKFVQLNLQCLLLKIVWHKYGKFWNERKNCSKTKTVNIKKTDKKQNTSSSFSRSNTLTG